MSANISYERVNDALNEVFFDGRFAGHPVYLSLDSGMRAELSAKLGLPARSVEETACEVVGQSLARTGDPYAPAISKMLTWQRGGMSAPPPFTGVLFCLAHAAEMMAAEGNFGSNNYYIRLAQLTDRNRSTLSLHGKSTDALWIGLSQWLLKQNYELGRPTARAINSWTYVGKAISQAVVRAGDREFFHNLFEKLGFSGNETITVQYMKYYLSDWMVSSRPNRHLRNAWRDNELKDRVAEVAISELLTWGSSRVRQGSQSTNVASARLSLVANLVRKFPATAFELHLGFKGDDIRKGPYNLKGSNGIFYLANDRFGTFATLSPSPLNDSTASLQYKLFFDGPSSHNLEWQPRAIIPFSSEVQSQLWIERRKVAFGEPHLVLVRDTHNLPQTVEAYLAEVTLKKPQKATRLEMPGLPLGWVLYLGVQVCKLTEDPNGELECLVPIIEEGYFSITEGLQLLKNFYHSSKKLNANYLAAQGPVYIEVSTFLDSQSVPILKAASEGNECVLEINPNQFNGVENVHIQIFEKGRVSYSIELFFRDANKPTPLNLDHRGVLGYGNIISAQPIAEVSNLYVVGLAIQGTLSSSKHGEVLYEDSLPLGTDEVTQDAILANTLSMQIKKQVCVENGYHYFVIPYRPRGRGVTKPLKINCRDCDSSSIIVGIKKKIAITTNQNFPKFSTSMSPEVEKCSIDFDILYDALCFIGNGSWGKFQSFIGTPEEASISPRIIAENLFLLGFLDLEIRPGSGAIKSWCVPGPSLNFQAPMTAYLSGFRCNVLISDIEQSIQKLGGVMKKEKINGRPTLIQIEGINSDDAASALASVVDPLGRSVKFNYNPAADLTRACLLIGSVKSALVPVSIGRQKNLQRFDVKNARWENIDEAFRPGAYRWNDGLQTYAYLSEDGTVVASGYQVIKLMAARSAGIRLHGYDRNTKTFLSTLGCDPPGILGRALVACSGRLPEFGRGMATYQMVPSDIASSILSYMYDGGYLDV